MAETVRYTDRTARSPAHGHEETRARPSYRPKGEAEDASEIVLENGSQRGRREVSRRPGKEGMRGACAIRQGANVSAPADGRIGVCGPPSAKVHGALDDLQAAGVLEFVTPVLLDPESDTRQVLTDEIVAAVEAGTHRADARRAQEPSTGSRSASRNEFEPTQYIVKVPQASGTTTLDVARSLDQARRRGIREPELHHPASNGRSVSAPSISGSLLRDA